MSPSMTNGGSASHMAWDMDTTHAKIAASRQKGLTFHKGNVRRGH